MKKINLLIAAGLMASASMQAQVVASLGFEDSDPRNRGSQWALNHQENSFGDWVNIKDGDVWTEQFAAEDLPTAGEYCFQMVNGGSGTAATWERGFKFVLPEGAIEENTPYRVSFWLKAFSGAHVTSWLSQGTENYDKSFCTADNQNFGITDKTVEDDEWHLVSFCSFYQAADTLNNVIAGQDWVGNAKFPVEFGGDGTQLYRDYFDHKLPNEYFFIANLRTAGEYYVDDIVVEKGITYNQVYFGETRTSEEAALKFDFGFPTNIGALAEADPTGTLSLDPSCVTVTVNGEPVAVKSLEGKSDGFLYAFFDENVEFEEDDEVVVSFTPAADCPIKYTTSLRPSSDRFSEMKVLPIAGAVGVFETGYDIYSLEAAPGNVVSTNPENESFEIDPTTFNKITITYDKELDVSSTSAVLTWANGTKTKDLSDNLTLSEDGKTVEIALTEQLEDGEYKLNLYDVETKFWTPCPDVELTFAIGPDNDQTISESVYSTTETFKATAEGTFPKGWVSNDNGTIHQYGVFADGAYEGQVYNYSWGANMKQVYNQEGGARGFTGFSGDIDGSAIYWRNFDGNSTLGTLTFGEQVKNYILEGGAIDPDMPREIGLYLDAKKHQITILMCAWKNLTGNVSPIYTFTLEDLDGNVYAKFEDVKAMPNMNGARGKVTNATKSVTDFTVPKPGYYVLKFASTQSGAELLLGSVNIITMPSKAAFWKQKLAAAAQDASTTLVLAEDAKYDGDTKTALQEDYNNATTGHYTSPSEIQALIDKMAADAAKLETRMNNLDAFGEAIAGIEALPEDLTGKYLEADLAKTALQTINTYKDANPSALSDEELAEVTPKLAAATNQLKNVKGVVDALTKGINKGIETYEKIGTDDAAALSAAQNAVSDDRAVADAINEANKARVIAILANELVEEQIPEQYLTQVGTIAGIELTGFIKNPKLYRQLNVNGIPGWNLTAGSDSTNLNIDYGGGAPSAEKPVINNWINIYGNADYNLSQTLENLPAGIYAVQFQTRTPYVDKTADFGKIFYYDAQDSITGEWDKYIYAGDSVAPYKGVGSYYGNDDDANADPAYFTFVTNIEVGEEGTLLIGAKEHYISGVARNHEKNEPQAFWTGTTMCDDARIFLVAPLPGYDYKKEADAIEVVKAIEVKTNGAIFNVAGQRVGADYKGIVIKNGKKYLNK